MLIDDVRICQFREETLVEKETRVINEYVSKWKNERKCEWDYFDEAVYGRTASDLAIGYKTDKQTCSALRQKSSCNSGAM